MGLDYHPTPRYNFGLELHNRVFDTVGPRSVWIAGDDPAMYYNSTRGVGNPLMLKDSDLDYSDDFFVLVPSAAVRLNEAIAINAGIVINLAEDMEPNEDLQFVVGVTINGAMSSVLDGDKDGVKNNRDLEPETPEGYPVDENGVSLDTDSDGVPDGGDRQANTPYGAKVDMWGVGIDSDGDGVYDGIDREPNTPAGCNVDVYGVALDGDKDGVPDCLDQESDTPMGCPVDKNGVALDGDRDGVPDCKDLEPNTPEGTPVDSQGRALKKQEISLIQEGMIRMDNIYFATGSATLKPESYGSIKEVAEILAKYPRLKIQIQGHTDSTGSRQKNMALSQARAESVLNAVLMGAPGLDKNRFSAVGFGPDRPISTNKTEAGRQLNRRVEFVVLNREVLQQNR